MSRYWLTVLILTACATPSPCDRLGEEMDRTGYDCGYCNGTNLYTGGSLNEAD